MPFASVNGTELYYERRGEGRPVVFCHGDGRDRRAWAPQVEALADEFELITYDLNGFGKSGGSSRDQLSFEVHAEDLAALVDQLGLTEPAVVGWSMGGRVAYTYAARHPDEVSALALLEPASPDFGSPPAPIRLLMRTVPPIASVVGWPRLFSVKRTVIDSGSDAEEEIAGLGMTQAEYVADAESRVDTAAYNKFTAATRREMASDDGPTVNLRDLDAPVLAITGEDPASNHEETVAELLEHAPNARRETVLDGSHSAHLDNPEAFNEILRTFILANTGGTTRRS